MIWGFILFFIGGYLLGSIPWGLLIVKWVKGIDIRSVGSGNIGATNVYRVLGIRWAILTFLLDALKGFLPVFAAEYFFNSTLTLIFAFSPFIGHCYPIWLKFRGGKGVATSAGILLAVAPVAFIISLILWGITVLITKISSLGALVAAVALPFSTYFISGDYQLTIFTVILSIWVILRHRENIERLLRGEEKTKRML